MVKTKWNPIDASYIMILSVVVWRVKTLVSDWSIFCDDVDTFPMDYISLLVLYWLVTYGGI